jgi:hypothetical protein
MSIVKQKNIIGIYRARPRKFLFCENFFTIYFSYLSFKIVSITNAIKNNKDFDYSSSDVGLCEPKIAFSPLNIMLQI